MWWMILLWSSTLGVFVLAFWLCPQAPSSDGRGMTREGSMAML
jgi:hypothetical protein